MFEFNPVSDSQKGQAREGKGFSTKRHYKWGGVCFSSRVIFFPPSKKKRAASRRYSFYHEVFVCLSALNGVYTPLLCMEIGFWKGGAFEILMINSLGFVQNARIGFESYKEVSRTLSLSGFFRIIFFEKNFNLTKKMAKKYFSKIVSPIVF